MLSPRSGSSPLSSWCCFTIPGSSGPTRMRGYFPWAHPASLSSFSAFGLHSFIQLRFRRPARGRRHPLVHGRAPRPHLSGLRPVAARGPAGVRGPRHQASPRRSAPHELRCCAGAAGPSRLGARCRLRAQLSELVHLHRALLLFDVSAAAAARRGKAGAVGGARLSVDRRRMLGLFRAVGCLRPWPVDPIGWRHARHGDPGPAHQVLPAGAPARVHVGHRRLHALAKDAAGPMDRRRPPLALRAGAFPVRRDHLCER